ncbi:unnamed protein product [Meganyctiphanes norvegica]|uniref:C-type lectin n=1 Tax=Meganyctiphanes norvegica TaxID=48144 RepID=A0AAV2QB76_MEGNR
MLALFVVGLVATTVTALTVDANNPVVHEELEPHLVLSYADSLARCEEASMPAVMPKTPEMWKQVSETLFNIGYGDEHMWVPAKMADDGTLKWMDGTDVTLTNITPVESDVDTSEGLCLAMSPEEDHHGELAPCYAVILPMICHP